MNSQQLQNKYVQQVLEDLNASTLPEDQQKQIVDMLLGRFNKVIMLALIKCASSLQQARLNTALNTPGALESKVEEIAAEIPNFHVVVEEALVLEYQTLKAGMQGK